MKKTTKETLIRNAGCVGTCAALLGVSYLGKKITDKALVKACGKKPGK